MLASQSFHFLDNKRGMKLNALVRAQKVNELLILKKIVNYLVPKHGL